MGEDNISRIGYASTRDGYTIDERLPYPVFEPKLPNETQGCEDPRISLVDNECIMTYTAYSCIFEIGLTRISVENILNKKWDWKSRMFPFPGVRDKNAVIFPQKIGGKYAMLHRLEPNICLAYSHNLLHWVDKGVIMNPREGSWDSAKIGAGGPPMDLGDKWLLIYHGVDHAKTYRLGVALLDKADPSVVLYRSTAPILEPTEAYECYGTVPNVVFSCGSILLDDKLLIYYGGADTVVSVATEELGKLLPMEVAPIPVAGPS